MKILFTHRYFWPDTAPYAVMLRSIAEAAAEDGHDVHVFASKPSYRGGARAPMRERIGKMNVSRTWTMQETRGMSPGRILNVALFCIPQFFHILRLRPDVVTSSTFPPVLEGLSAALAARLIGARMVYHMQDIHPEVSQVSGDRMGRGIAFRILRWLDAMTHRRSSATVVLSEDMANTLRGRPGLPELPIRVINNFALDSFETPGNPPAELAKSADRRRVIFAGNLGRFQNLPLLAEGVGRLFEKYPDLELFFLGDGAALGDLQARWGDHEQVRFGPFLPFADAKELIRDADIGLVSLAPNVYRVSYPSKVLTYIGLGLPMLAMVEPESQLAREIEDQGLGAVPAAPTPEGIAEALDRLLSDPDRLARTRQNVTAYHDSTAALPAVLRKWRALFEDLAKQGR